MHTAERKKWSLWIILVKRRNTGQVRDSYVRWCESLNLSYLAQVGLLDYRLYILLLIIWWLYIFIPRHNIILTPKLNKSQAFQLVLDTIFYQ